MCCEGQALDADFTGAIRQQDVRAHEVDKVRCTHIMWAEQAPLAVRAAVCDQPLSHIGWCLTKVKNVYSHHQIAGCIAAGGVHMCAQVAGQGLLTRWTTQEVPQGGRGHLCRLDMTGDPAVAAARCEVTCCWGWEIGSCTHDFTTRVALPARTTANGDRIADRLHMPYHTMSLWYIVANTGSGNALLYQPVCAACCVVAL
jgi:hypothetical protein